MRSWFIWTNVICGLVTLAVFPVSAHSPGRPRAGEPVDRPAQAVSTDARPSGAAQRIVGAWQLMTRTVSGADGTTLADPVLGDRPLGRLFYDASGVMMLQMMRLERTAAIGKPTSAKDETNPRVLLGYDAYFGRYTLDERAGTITHHVEGSLFPEDLGKDFVRGFTLDDDTLTLRFTSPADDGAVTRTLVFRRSR
jgi:Lipocalin-like domain